MTWLSASILVVSLLAPLDDPATPQATLDSTEASWGSLIQGDQHTITIPIRNTGTAPLKILKVLPSCGCATATFDAEIAPGESGKVEVVIDSSNIVGPTLLKFVTIQTNDPAAHSIRFWVKGEVKPLMKAEPPHLRLSDFPGKPLSLTAIVSAATELDVDLLEITPREGHVKVTFEPVEKGRSYRLKLSAPAHPHARALPEKLDVRVRTSDGKERRLEWSALIEHRRRWEIEPSVIAFNDTLPLEKGEVKELVQEVKVRAIAPDFELKIVRAEVTSDTPGFFATEIRTDTPGREYTVLVKLVKAIETGHAKGVLEIEVNTEAMNQQRVFVRAYF